MTGTVTNVLADVRAGEGQSADLLLPLVYRELRQLAAARLRSERAGHTLQATALVHEAYLRLLKPAHGRHLAPWSSRAHFFSAAAEAMRRILVENARRKRRQKHGGDKARLLVDVDELPSSPHTIDLLEIEEVLGQLEAEHPDHAVVVKLRYFTGLTIAECADVLEVATPTVERRWSYARAWLAQRLTTPNDRQNTAQA